MRATANASSIHKQQKDFNEYPAAKVRDSRKSTRSECA